MYTPLGEKYSNVIFFRELFFHLPERLGGLASVFSENSAEVGRIVEPDPGRDGCYRIRGVTQQFLRFQDAETVQAVPGRQSNFLMEYPAQVV